MGKPQYTISLQMYKQASSQGVAQYTKRISGGDPVYLVRGEHALHRLRKARQSRAVAHLQRAVYSVKVRPQRDGLMPAFWRI